MDPLLVLTIGQAPRPDLVAELAEVLGDQPIEVRGALDGLTLAEVESLAPIDDPDALHTHLFEAPGSDGPVDVIISKKAVTNRFADLISAAEGRPVMVGCTGTFVGLPERPDVLLPSKILSGLIDATLPPGRRLGVLVPIPEQVELFTEIRGGPNRPVTVSVVRPGQDPSDAANELRDAGVELVVLDCFGYSRELLATVQEITGVPVLSAVRVTARLAQELLG